MRTWERFVDFAHFIGGNWVADSDVTTNCNPANYAQFGAASGYYHHPWGGAPDPEAAGLPAWIWIR